MAPGGFDPNSFSSLGDAYYLFPPLRERILSVGIGETYAA
jgi:hypothetical protein